MQNHNLHQTIKRSKLRLWLGRYFYILRRHLEWIFSDRKFATELKCDRLPVKIFSH
nr:hypothetical protein [Pseudanabaena sp. ABRG5-3]